MSDKKIVRFDPAQTLLLKEGYCALIVPVDHPSADVTNKGLVQTTMVEKIEANGAFETMNTRYCPIHVEYVEELTYVKDESLPYVRHVRKK